MTDPLVGGSRSPVQRQAGDWGARSESWEIAGGYQSKVDAVLGMSGNLQAAAVSLQGVGDGQDLAVATRNLMQVAGDLIEAADIYQQFLDQRIDLSAVGGRVGKGKQIVDSLLLVSALTDSEAMEAYMADPENLDKARDWAFDAADTFERASALVPGGIPIVSDMLKGYLSAPAAYVRAFTGILTNRIYEIDNMAGITKGAAYERSGKVVFKGALAQVAAEAGSTVPDLWQFMDENRARDGIHLERVGRELGLAHLIGLIDRYAAAEDYCSAQRAGNWLSFLRRKC